MPGAADADRWVVFDLFGVIVKEGHLVHHVLLPLCKGRCNGDEAEIISAYVKYREGKISREEFNRIVPRGVEEELLKEIEPERDIVDLLARLKGLGWKVGIITNAAELWGRKVIREIEKTVKLDAVVISAEVGVAKPDPRIYEIFLERTGAIPKSVIYVDDKVEDLVPASRLGMKTILFAREGVDAVAKSTKSLHDIIFSFHDEPPLD